MVLLNADGGGGGAAKSAGGKMTASDGGPSILSFAGRRGDIIRGFVVHVCGNSLDSVNDFRIFASLSNFPAKVNDDVLRSGAAVIIDMFDSTGNSDWLHVNGSHGFYIHVNHLCKDVTYLNISLRSDNSPSGPFFLVSADIVPSDIVGLMAGKMLGPGGARCD